MGGGNIEASSFVARPPFRYPHRQAVRLGMSLTGQVALVTGGARGIGKAVSEALVREGCKVRSTVHHPGAGQSAARSCTAAVLAQGRPRVMR